MWREATSSAAADRGPSSSRRVRSRSAPRSPLRSTPRTPAGLSTGTSSPRTCSSTRTITSTWPTSDCPGVSQIWGANSTTGSPSVRLPTSRRSRSNAVRCDGRADEYALGCLLYECLTGEAPFSRASELAVLWAHVQEPPPTASEHNPDLPIEIDPVFARAMAKDPDDRYASVQRAGRRRARELLGFTSPPRFAAARRSSSRPSAWQSPR